MLTYFLWMFSVKSEQAFPNRLQWGSLIQRAWGAVSKNSCWSKNRLLTGLIYVCHRGQWGYIQLTSSFVDYFYHMIHPTPCCKNWQQSMNNRVCWFKLFSQFYGLAMPVVMFVFWAMSVYLKIIATIKWPFNSFSTSSYWYVDDSWISAVVQLFCTV